MNTSAVLTVQHSVLNILILHHKEDTLRTSSVGPRVYSDPGRSVKTEHLPSEGGTPALTAKHHVTNHRLNQRK